MRNGVLLRQMAPHIHPVLNIPRGQTGLFSAKVCNQGRKLCVNVIREIPCWVKQHCVMEPKISMYITVTKMSMHKTRLQSIIVILMFISKAFAILVSQSDSMSFSFANEGSSRMSGGNTLFLKASKFGPCL